MKPVFIFLLLFSCSLQMIAQQTDDVAFIKTKTDSVRNFIYTGPSADLLPEALNAEAKENEYYGGSDAASKPTFYRGHVFSLKLRDNCSFIYETFYTPYQWARIEYAIGCYRISGDTIYLSYQSLLPGKPGAMYVSPTLSISWVLPQRPAYLLISKKGLAEPYEQRLKKKSFYVLAGTSNFELSCK